MSIIDLQEVSPNNWKAKYRGNYGTYTIKIATDGKKTTNFSCSCPSDYYPCKHIAMVKEEIRKRIATVEKTSQKKDKVSIESILEKTTPDELRAFILRQAKYNPELSNCILLEFAHKATDNSVNSFSPIIREALQNTHFDIEDAYECEEGYLEIDVLDQWINKAQQYVNQGSFREAIMICKSCIEEFADWLADIDGEVLDYIDDSYQYTPFTILADITSLSDDFSKDLFDYCKAEMPKAKYKGSRMYSEFNDLMGIAAPAIDPNYFLTLQDSLLASVTDKSSSEAKEILQRKINLYRDTGETEKAWEIIMNNLQIESFRKELVEKYISESKFSEAKALIADVNHKKDNYPGFSWNTTNWDTYLLTIAQKEKDIPAIRKITLSFLEPYFREEYYRIYKSTFTLEEWALSMEKLIQHYQARGNSFSSSIADILVIEKQKQRLMDYVEKHLSTNTVENYYSHFPSQEKTLALFRQAIDKYASEHTGRSHYEYIARLFELMRKIPGGQDVINQMTSHYKSLYKSRRAMMEVLKIR